MAESELHDGFELAETRRTLPMALLRGRELVLERFRPMLHNHEISEQHWRVIRVLSEMGEVDATQLAQSACVLAPSLTRMLRALEERGFIHVRRDPQDGRRALIRLSDQGRDFIRLVSPEGVAIYAEIERIIGRARLDNLLNELEFLQEQLDLARRRAG